MEHPLLPTRTPAPVHRPPPFQDDPDSGRPRAIRRLPFALITLVLTVLVLTGCRSSDRAPDLPPLDPRVARYLDRPLYVLEDARAAVAGRDDLTALDTREAIRLAWRNRSPEQVSGDVSDIPAAHRERERTLRRAWREEHVAFSWDNRNPDAQLLPAPEDLSLSWRYLALQLPRARNFHPFEEDWVRDYFQRKRWYHAKDPQEGLTLSWMDRVQMKNAREAFEEITVQELRTHAASLPRSGMSPEEAAIEAALVQRLLGGEE